MTDRTVSHTSTGTVSMLVLAVTRADDRQQPLGRLAARAVHTDLLQEAPLAVRPEISKVYPGRYPLLVHGAQPGRDAEPQQQSGQVLDEPPRRGGVVDPSATPVPVDGDRPIGGPDVPKEQRDLPLRRVEQPLGHELLVAAQPKQPQFVNHAAMGCAPRA
jgi:hypothetical protein